MSGSGHVIQMIRRIQANRALMLAVRNKAKHKHRALQKLTGSGERLKFNEAFCDPKRPAVRANRRRVARELKKYRREDSLKTLIAVVLTGLLFLLVITLWNQL